MGAQKTRRSNRRQKHNPSSGIAQYSRPTGPTERASGIWKSRCRWFDPGARHRINVVPFVGPAPGDSAWRSGCHAQCHPQAEGRASESARRGPPQPRPSAKWTRRCTRRRAIRGERRAATQGDARKSADMRQAQSRTRSRADQASWSSSLTGVSRLRPTPACDIWRAGAAGASQVEPTRRCLEYRRCHQVWHAAGLLIPRS